MPIIPKADNKISLPKDSKLAVEFGLTLTEAYGYNYYFLETGVSYFAGRVLSTAMVTHQVMSDVWEDYRHAKVACEVYNQRTRSWSFVFTSGRKLPSGAADLTGELCSSVPQSCSKCWRNPRRCGKQREIAHVKWPTFKRIPECPARKMRSSQR